MTLRVLTALVLVLAMVAGCTTTITLAVELDRPMTLGADGQDGDT